MPIYHGGLARSGKVKNQTPKQEKKDKKKKLTGRAKKRKQANKLKHNKKQKLTPNAHTTEKDWDKFSMNTAKTWHQEKEFLHPLKFQIYFFSHILALKPYSGALIPLYSRRHDYSHYQGTKKRWHVRGKRKYCISKRFLEKTLCGEDLVIPFSELEHQNITEDEDSVFYWSLKVDYLKKQVQQERLHPTRRVYDSDDD